MLYLLYQLIKWRYGYLDLTRIYGDNGEEEWMTKTYGHFVGW